MLAVQDLKISREKALRSQREAVAKQEARLVEQLEVNRTLQQKISKMVQEAELQRKAAFLRSMGKGGPVVEKVDGLEAWKNVRHMMAFVTGAREATAQSTSAERDDKNQRRVDKLCQVICDDLQPEDLNKLVEHIMHKSDTENQLEIVQTVLDALQPSVQASIIADILESFTAHQISQMFAQMGEDNEGADAVERFKRALGNDGMPSSAQGVESLVHQFECATPKVRKEYLQGLNGLLTDGERNSLLASLPLGATEAPMNTTPESADDVWLKRARRSSDRKISLRRTSVTSTTLHVEPTNADAAVPVSPKVPVSLEVQGAIESQELSKSCPQQRMARGALAIQLQKKPPGKPEQMPAAELLRLVAAAVCHRFKVEGVRDFDETVWEYICVAKDIRSAALQQLHNLNFSLAIEAAASNEDPTASPVRITAFRALSGLHPPRGSAWPSSQSVFYLFAMYELLTANAQDVTLVQLQRTLSQKLVYIELPQVVFALRNLVSETTLLSDITAQVMEMAAEEVVAERHPSPAVSLDWILDQLMAAWTGANAKAEEQLQELFVKADDNGDGARATHAHTTLSQTVHQQPYLCCRCAVAFRVPSATTDATWRDAGEPCP